jgi:hypothetical protein
MFQGPKLKHVFSGSGGKMPKPDAPPGLLDPFKAAVVSFKGPALCDKLNATLDILIKQNSNHGVARDVRTHLALQGISNRVRDFRIAIQEGGAQSYHKLKDAGVYLTRLQKFGLDA